MPGLPSGGTPDEPCPVPGAPMSALSRRQSATLTLILGGLQAFGPLSIDMYLPGLPTIARDLGVSDGAAQFTLSAFLIGMALGQASYGPATDKYGRKKPLLFGVALYVLASVICARSPSIEVLILGRFLQALGASAGAVITTAIVRDLYSGREAADRFSLLMLVMGVAPILAPLLGGLILSRFDWHALFWMLAGLGVLCWLSVTGLTEPSRAAERAQARLRDAAGTYLALLRQAPFMTYALGGAFASSAMFAYISGSSFVFIGALHVSPGVYSLLFGLNALGLIAASQVNRALIRRFPLARITGVANSFTLLFALGLGLVTLTGHAAVLTLAPLLLGLLITLGFTFPNTTTLALDNVRTRLGSAAALRGTLQFVISGLAGSAVGVLSNGAFPERPGLAMAVVIVACALLSTLFLALARRVAPPELGAVPAD